MADLDAELTELLRDMRHEAGLTQAQLAERMGYATQTNACAQVSNYERGRRIPKVELLGRWAAACGWTARLVVEHPEGYLPRWVVALDGDRDG